MANNKEEKNDVGKAINEEKENSFLDINAKEIKRSIISNIKKQLILFPVSPFNTDTILSYKIAYDFLTSNPNKKLLWFSADRPVKKILNAFKENGFDIVDHKDRIIFVDMVSKLSSDSNDTRGFEVIYIDNPNNLVEVSITLQEVLADESIELAIIDSLNGILAFNDEKNVLKFVRFLSSIAEETDTAIISILYKGQYSNELETAFQIPCDGILSVEEEKIILKKKLETIII